MPKPKRVPVKTDHQADREAAVTVHRMQVIGAIVNKAITGAIILGVAFFGASAIQALAGETTSADIGIKFLADVKISTALALAFGAGGVTYGWRREKLRQKTVERLGTRNRELEEKWDARRTSSKLTPRGRTNPRDKL